VKAIRAPPPQRMRRTYSKATHAALGEPIQGDPQGGRHGPPAHASQPQPTPRLIESGWLAASGEP